MWLRYRKLRVKSGIFKRCCYCYCWHCGLIVCVSFVQTLTHFLEPMTVGRTNNLKVQFISIQQPQLSISVCLIVSKLPHITIRFWSLKFWVLESLWRIMFDAVALHCPTSGVTQDSIHNHSISSILTCSYRIPYVCCQCTVPLLKHIQTTYNFTAVNQIRPTFNNPCNKINKSSKLSNSLMPRWLKIGFLKECLKLLPVFETSFSYHSISHSILRTWVYWSVY